MHRQSQECTDPVFLHSKREAKELLIAFLIFLIWSIGVSYWLGYSVPSAEIATIWGIPSWVFWGVAVPWAGANLFTIYFCLFRMADDPLDDGPQSGSAEEGGTQENSEGSA